METLMKEADGLSESELSEVIEFIHTIKAKEKTEATERSDRKERMERFLQLASQVELDKEAILSWREASMA